MRTKGRIRVFCDPCIRRKLYPTVLCREMARANGTRSKHALVVQGRLDGSGPAAVLVAVVLPMHATSEIPWKKRFESKDRDKNGEIERADLLVTLSPGLAKRFSAREVRMRERGMTSANYREFLERDGNGDSKFRNRNFELI